MPRKDDYSEEIYFGKPRIANEDFDFPKKKKRKRTRFLVRYKERKKVFVIKCKYCVWERSSSSLTEALTLGDTHTECIQMQKTIRKGMAKEQIKMEAALESNPVADVHKHLEDLLDGR